jgi:hypothetical protein
MEERESDTSETFGDQPAGGQPGGSGYPEEQPGGSDPSGGAKDPDEKGTDKTVDESSAGDQPGSSEGASGEGTQATGHPQNAG